MRRQIGAYVLQPAGLTNVASADVTNATSINYLQQDALYSFDGVTPTFTEGSQTLLSDAISNSNSSWTLMGYGGETSAAAAGFIPSNVIHRYLGDAGDAQVTRTDSTPVVLYSHDGPQGYMNQYYLRSANQVIGTGSIRLGNQITGSGIGFTKLRVWIAGAIPTGAVGSTLTVFTGANGPAGAPLLTFSASVTPLMQSASFTFDASTNITLRMSSSVNTYNLNSFVPGLLVYITGSST
jgi:hypothetical protein